MRTMYYTNVNYSFNNIILKNTYLYLISLWHCVLRHNMSTKSYKHKLFILKAFSFFNIMPLYRLCYIAWIIYTITFLNVFKVMNKIVKNYIFAYKMRENVHFREDRADKFRQFNHTLNTVRTQNKGVLIILCPKN